MSKVTKGYYSGYVASAYWSTNKLSKPKHYREYVTLEDADLDELKHFGSVLITWFSTDELGDVYPCCMQDFTPIGFNLSKDKPKATHNGNTLSLVFEEDNAPPVQPKEKTSIYKDRDNDCRAWIESENPLIDKMTKTQVHECLKERDKDEGRIKKLWSHGFPDWCRRQQIITFKTGRHKK